jgi:hypothetical protein
MIFLAVFLVSLSALAFEVLLARVFSISQWNHLSFMVISIALFGFAASGTFLNIIEIRKTGWARQLSTTQAIRTLITLYSLITIISFIVLNRMPLDYFRLPLETVQILYLLTAYLLLALPFFFTGLVVSIAYAFIPEKTGFIYLANMAGSALGAMLPILLLPFIGEGKLIIVSALVPLVILLCNQPSTKAKLSPQGIRYWTRPPLLIFILAILLVAGMFVSAGGKEMIKIRPSPYKALSQSLQFPDTRVTATITGIRGRYDNVHSPYNRFAPGLSLKFTDTLPSQQATFKDGDDPLYLYNITSPKDAWFSRFTLPYAGYLLAPDPEHVLVVQTDGGSSIPCALASGARNITIIKQQPYMARIVRRHYNINVINQNPRTYLARSDKRFHVIQIENWGSSLPGTAALSQGYLFTTESFSEYFSHLTENGILVISRKLLLPPANSIRIFAGAYESMKSLGIKNPEQHMAILRNWNTFSLIVSAQPLENKKLLIKFARNLNFDLIYIPGMTEQMANRFNIFDAPYYFSEINRLLKAYQSGIPETFYAAYPIDVSPQNDSRPFPERFLKWSKLKTLYKITGSRFYSLFMSGEIVIAVVFFEALLISVLLLVFPLMSILKQSQKLRFPHVLYFFAVGAGFMFVELFFIKKYTFVFGDPIVSFTIVLGGILIFSGFGGYFSHKIGYRGLRYALLALIVFLILIFFGIDPMINRILGLSKMLRYVLTALLLIFSGLLLGLPFPLGMRYLLNNPSQRAYAWTTNGCASVLASIASAQIALSLGIPTLIALGAIAYLLAIISLLIH